MAKRSSKGQPADDNQIAKAIVDRATGRVQRKKNQAAVELGRLGGKKGGPARAKKLTAERRKEIARKAAQVRWNK